jgi:hypothetical protein
MAEQSLSKRQHVNILALPSQTVLISLLIMLVIIGALIAINFNVPAFLFLMLSVLLVIVAFRGILSWSDHRRQTLRLTRPQGLANLEAAIEALSHNIDLPYVPQLLVTANPIEIHTFGSFQRWYIAVNQERAQALDTLLSDPQQRPIAEAAILHELYHFKHRDNIWTELARSFLFRGGLLIVWFGLLMFGLFALSFLAKETLFTRYSPNQLGEIFDLLLPGLGNGLAISLFGTQEEWEQLREQAQRTDFNVAMFSIILNTLPFAVFAFVMLLTLWRRLLLLREVYADAGTVRTQGRIAPLVQAVIQSSQNAPDGTTTKQTYLVRLFELAQRLKYCLYKRLKPSSLTLAKRLHYLRNPERIYEGWWSSGLLIGLFVVGTNMLLSGTSALFFIGSWPIHFPALVAALLLCFSIVLPIVIGRPLLKSVARSIGIILVIHTSVILIALALLIFGAVFAPSRLAYGIDFLASILVWYTNITTDVVPEDPWPFVIQATVINLSQIPILFVMLVLPLVTHYWITRRLLTWYSFPYSEQRLMLIIQSLVWLQLAIIGLVLLPPLTDLALQRGIEGSGSPWYWLFSMLTLTLTIVVVIRLFSWDRVYAGRCPSCKSLISGSYFLGRCCPNCNQLLHSWLISEYDTEPNR